MTDEITYPEGTGQTMRNYTAGGIALGLALYGAHSIGSAFLTGALLIMSCLIFLWFFQEMRHATLMAKVGPQVTDEMRAIYASPARIAIQVLVIMGISIFAGFGLGWALDFLIF